MILHRLSALNALHVVLASASPRRREILRDVVESNFKAEARHDALEEVRRRKLEHWEEEQMAFSARVLQKLYRHWKAHKEPGRLKWKVKNNELKRKNKARGTGAAPRCRFRAASSCTVSCSRR